MGDRKAWLIGPFVGLLAGALGLGGCHHDDPSGTTADEGVTWHSEIAPLLADRCGACHRTGGIAPFSVETYEDAAPWGAAIADAVQSGRMPPFFATESDECDMQIGFLDDVRLSDEDKQKISDWVDADMPEGTPRPPPPPHESRHIEAPDAVLPIPEPFAVSGDRDIYQCFRVEVGNTEDIWLTGIEVIPDNDLVVHHVLVWNDPEDGSASEVGPDGSYRCSGFPDIWPTELVAAWTPGGSPTLAPEGAGSLFHPGATLVVNVHYHPTGTTTELDRSSIALQWTDQQPEHHTTWYLVDLPFGAETDDGQFAIPARSRAHVETVSLEIPTFVPWDLTVFAITPHMHYLGTEMLVTKRSGGIEGEECLIHAKDYRFDFQTSYIYDPSTGSLPVLRPGDSVDVRCTYNNSRSNPYLDLQLEASGASEPRDVYWGEETSDEMCMAMVGLILPPVDWLELAGGLF